MSAIKKPMPVVGTATKAYEKKSHIRIVTHHSRKRNRFRTFMVKTITVTGFLLNLYSIMLMEFHPRIGLSIFGITFIYLMAFLKANGGI